MSRARKRKPHLRTFQIGAPPKRGEGLRIGTTRRPPRGVPKNRWQSGGYFDLWFPVIAPSVFTPRFDVLTGEPDGYDFSCPTRFDRLFTGIVCVCPWPDDTGRLGSEGITAEDTGEADYGRLLERAAARLGKVGTSPSALTHAVRSIRSRFRLAG